MKPVEEITGKAVALQELFLEPVEETTTKPVEETAVVKTVVEKIAVKAVALEETCVEPVLKKFVEETVDVSVVKAVALGDTCWKPVEECTVQVVALEDSLLESAEGITVKLVEETSVEEISLEAVAVEETTKDETQAVEANQVVHFFIGDEEKEQADTQSDDSRLPLWESPRRRHRRPRRPRPRNHGPDDAQTAAEKAQRDDEEAPEAASESAADVAAEADAVPQFVDDEKRGADLPEQAMLEELGFSGALCSMSRAGTSSDWLSNLIGEPRPLVPRTRGDPSIGHPRLPRQRQRRGRS